MLAADFGKYIRECVKKPHHFCVGLLDFCSSPVTSSSFLLQWSTHPPAIYRQLPPRHSPFGLLLLWWGQLEVNNFCSASLVLARVRTRSSWVRFRPFQTEYAASFFKAAHTQSLRTVLLRRRHPCSVLLKRFQVSRLRWHGVRANRTC